MNYKTKIEFNYYERNFAIISKFSSSRNLGIVMKYGFLFGAGAEIAYNLPSGGQFALDILGQDISEVKQRFKIMRDNIDASTTYASQWLPKDYQTKNINTFVKTMRANGIDVNKAFPEVLGSDVSDIQLSQSIAYNNFSEGNKLFESNYFSALLVIYRDQEGIGKQSLRRILLSIMQLQLGALSEKLSRNINDNLSSKKDESIDIFDDFGELIIMLLVFLA